MSHFGPQTPPTLLESTSEESANESDIFGSTISSSSSSSDFEEELKKTRSKRKTNRRLSSRSDVAITDGGVGGADTPSQDVVANSVPSTTPTFPSPPPLPPALLKKEEPVKREVKYSKRTATDDKRLLEQFLHSGLDKEEILMMRLAFLRLRDEEPDIISGVPWAYYPPDILLLLITVN